jgi:DNA-binding NarL/FixJ family response regulator
MNGFPIDQSSAKTRVLVVDDHQMIRRGLSALMGQEKSLTIVASVGSATEALDAARREPFDLAVVDISLGQTDGIELTRRLKREWPALTVLILSMHDEDVYVGRARSAGASGFVPKQDAGEELLPAIANVMHGHQHFPDRHSGRSCRQSVS